MVTIAEIASGDDFTVLLGAVTAVDTALPETKLVETLSNPGNLTVFAPTNAAFASLATAIGYTGSESNAEGVLDFLATNLPAEVLRDVVLYHVLPTAQTAAQISENPTLATALGITISAELPSLVDQDPDLVNPSVVTANVDATNGVVHVIDQVLLPLDVEIGSDSRDYIRTDDANDLIIAKAGNDYIRSGDGNDVILAGEGRDYVNAGNGDDFIYGGEGNDRLIGSNGNDQIDGGAGQDRIYGGRDNDVITGGDGWDRLYGGSGDDVIGGGEDGDYLNGGRGDDTLNGDEGSDGLYGGSGDDALNGGEGRDGLYGGSGNDVLNGGAGNDYMNGGRGDDTLIAGDGYDRMSGGWGDDTFVFDQADDYNVIYGFGWHSDDKIDLTAFNFDDFSQVEEKLDGGWYGTTIDLGETEIYLSWVHQDHLTADDFIL